ncbi:MAG: LysR substrate-binding domain-containing protein [Paracoccaceae bacterium]
MAALNWKLLTAFEAVARHRSFTRAAREMNVQQPAISRRVAELEAELRIKLLRRTRPFATLTREGEVLFRAIAGGIMQVNSAMEQVRQRPDRHTLTVNTTIGFASCYLMKRLPEFRSSHPDTSVELISRDHNDAYDMDTDVLIAFDHPGRLPGHRKVPIFHETMVAVARPDLTASIGDDLGALAEQCLLYLTMGIHADDWRTFFAGTGFVLRVPASEEKFTSFMVYLQAALNGQGVILGWETLLQDHFDLGQLAPITDRRIKTPRGYFCCLMPRASENPSANQFLDWISG